MDDEEIVIEGRPTIQQENNLEISSNEMSQAIAQSLNCSIKYSCEVMIVDNPVFEKYHIESMTLDGNHINCRGKENGDYPWGCFEYSLQQCKSKCNENISDTGVVFQLHNIFHLRFAKNHEFFGLNEFSIPISCKVNRCKPLRKFVGRRL